MAENDKPEVHEVTARRRRSTEVPVTPEAPVTPVAEPVKKRNPAWPAQYGTDGWDQVPVQMRS